MIRLTRDNRYEVRNEENTRGFGVYETYEEAEARLAQVERFAAEKSVQTSAKDLRKRKAQRAQKNTPDHDPEDEFVLHESYAANPGVPLQDRIYNIIVRLQRNHPEGRVPLGAIRKLTADATRKEFDHAVTGLELRKKIQLHVDNTKPKEEGIFVPGRGLLFSASEAPLVVEEDDEEEDEVDEEDNEEVQPIVVEKPIERPALPVHGSVTKKSQKKTPIPRGPRTKPKVQPAQVAAVASEVVEASPVFLVGPPPPVFPPPAPTPSASQGLVLAKPATTSVALAEPVQKRIDEHPAAVYLARLAPGSRRTMGEALTTIATLLNSTPKGLAWQDLRYQHTQAIRAQLEAKYAPSYVNKMLSALRGVLREAMRLGLMTGDDYIRARDIPDVKGKRLMKGRMLSYQELGQIFGAIDPGTLHGSRNTAMTGVLADGGLRRAEVVDLDLKDVEGESLRVRGKGNKERRVYLNADVQILVNNWIEKRGNAPGPLFLPINKYGEIANRRMSDQAVLFILNNIQKDAKVNHFTPHDLRRTFISMLLDAGNDLSTVQQLSGHSSPTTTSRYDRRGEEVKKKAAASIDIPVNGI